MAIAVSSTTVSVFDILNDSIRTLREHNATTVPYANTTHTSKATTGEDNEDYDYYDDIDWERTSAEPFYRAANRIIQIAFPILIVMGTVGNSLVVAVLRRGGIHTDNLRFFLSILAVVDTVFLYASGFKTWVRVVWGFELLHLGSWSCKAGLFLTQLSVTLSAWLLVVITWQRWYTCSQPFRRCCPSENLLWRILGLAALIFILVAINSYVLFSVERVKTPYGYRCVPKVGFNYALTEIFPFILMALYSVVPALLLFILNGLLVRVLYQSRRALLSNNGANRGSGRDGKVRSRYNYVTAVLLALSTLWFVLTFPHTIVKMLELTPGNEEEHAVQLLVNVLLYVLIYINHSANFFIYFALLRGFRRQVKKMAKCAMNSVTSFQPKCSRSRETSVGTRNGDRNNSTKNPSHTDSFVPLLVHANGMWHLGRDVKVIQ